MTRASPREILRLSRVHIYPGESPKMKEKPVRVCLNCQGEFVNRKECRPQKFCSQACSKEHRIKFGVTKNPRQCSLCNIQFIPSYSKQKFCGHSCSATSTNKSRTKVKGYKNPQASKLRGINMIDKLKKSKTKDEWKRCPFTQIRYCPVTGVVLPKNSKQLDNKWCQMISHQMPTINLLATTFNIELKRQDTTSKLDDAFEKLRVAYEVDNMSTPELHKVFNIACSEGHVSNFLRGLGIKRRSFKEASKLAVETGRWKQPSGESSYINGDHIDWQGHIHHYRSSYELSFYLQLDELELPYETESKSILYYDSQRQISRYAIPDVIMDTLIYEIKSMWTYDRQNMADKFGAYKALGYTPYLILDGKLYEELIDSKPNNIYKITYFPK
jgi:uncharacterized protein YehS (DUF1456 family)